MLLSLSGCHRVSPIVGTWEAPVTVKSFTGTSQLQFDEDGTYRDIVTIVGKNAIAITTTGTWKLEDQSRLTTHVDDMQLQLIGSGAHADAARKLFEKNKAKMIADTNAHPTDVLTWHGNDSYSYVNQMGETRTFRRVK